MINLEGATSLSPGRRCDSDPNLAEIRAALRKRRHDEELTQSIDTQIQSVLKKLDSMKTDFDKSIESLNVNINITIKEDLAKLTEASNDVKAEMRSIRNEYSEMKTTIQELRSENENTQKDLTSLREYSEFNAGEQEEIKKTVGTLRSEIKKIDCLEREVVELRRQNTELSANINLQDQRERLLNIEILGIPESENENTKDVVLALVRYIGINISTDDVIHANRVSPRAKLQGRPRVIVAKLATRLLKDNIISASRKVRATTAALDIPGDSKPIIINEHLTVFNKQLLKKCKEAAKLKEYLYAWTKNGRIFVRKSDLSPHLLIATEEDLKKIK